jgi:hypothetical protein
MKEPSKERNSNEKNQNPTVLKSFIEIKPNGIQKFEATTSLEKTSRQIGENAALFAQNMA